MVSGSANCGHTSVASSDLAQMLYMSMLASKCNYIPLPTLTVFSLSLQDSAKMVTLELHSVYVPSFHVPQHWREQVSVQNMEEGSLGWKGGS